MQPVNAYMDENFLLQVRERNSIDTIVPAYVNLKRAGSNLVGLCPFHSEKSPSFHIFLDTQSFYCFGCGTGGDVITFIKKIENLEYIDALKLLADRAGLTLPEDNRMSEADKKLRVKTLEMNKLAARFYFNNLKAEIGKNALEYLHKRNLDDGTIIQFGIGYAPDGWSTLTEYLKTKGFYKEDMVAAGLAKQGNNNSIYDRFRNRIIFPVIDLRGNVIAFSGRILDNTEPKYLNSPETSVFIKGNNLFAMNFAKNSNTNRILLAEGQIDVIALHKAGFTEAVATLGTAITPQQARLISRYCKEVVIAYDNDTAGQKAAQKANNLLSAVGLQVKVLTLPEGNDPDDYIKENGADKFKMLLEDGQNFTEYNIDKLRLKYNLNESSQKVEFLKEATEILSDLKNPVEREVYINIVAKQAGISNETMISTVNKRYREKVKKQSKQEIFDQDKMLNYENREDRELKVVLKSVKSQERVISILYGNPDLAGFIKNEIASELFITDFLKQLYEILITRSIGHESTELISLGQYLTEKQMSKLTELVIRGKKIGYGNKKEILLLKDVLTEEMNKREGKELTDEELIRQMEEIKKKHNLADIV